MIQLLGLFLIALTGCAGITTQEQAAADTIKKNMNAQSVKVSHVRNVLIGDTEAHCVQYEIVMTDIDRTDKTASVLAVQLNDMLNDTVKKDYPGITIQLTDSVRNLSEKYSYLFTDLKLAGTKLNLVDSVISCFIKSDYMKVYNLMGPETKRQVTLEETIATFSKMDSTYGATYTASLQGVRFIKLDGRDVMQYEAILGRKAGNNRLLINIAKATGNEIVSIKL